MDFTKACSGLGRRRQHRRAAHRAAADPGARSDRYRREGSAGELHGLKPWIAHTSCIRGRTTWPWGLRGRLDSHAGGCHDGNDIYQFL